MATTPQSSRALAMWLFREHPELFLIIRQHQKTGRVQLKGLGDWSDALSSIGDTLSSAVSGVGDWLSTPSNITALTNVGASYFASQAAQANANTQLAVLRTQAARAQAGVLPAPITYAAGGMPVYQPTAGIQTPPYLGAPAPISVGQPAYQLTPQALQSLQPSFLQKYAMPLMLGGAGLLVLALIL